MNFTDGYTRVCGIIGNPVKHTLSPIIHNSLADMLGINLIYVPFEVKEEQVKSAIKGADALDITGINVTVPHKSAVIPHLQDIDPLAKAIGAVNTLVRTEKGGFKGYNTDMTGLYHAMKDEGIEIDGQTVVILGAGGVARPAAFLCASKGAKKVYVLNRTVEKAQAVAEEVNNAVYRLEGDDKLTSDGMPADGNGAEIPQIVIPMKLEDYKNLISTEEKFIALQCTSVGLFPDINSAVIEDMEFYEHVSSALDVVYRPLETKFMKLAREAGANVFSGLKMLLYQGIDAFELWNQDLGVKITKEQADEVYKSLMLEVLGAGNIILEGFMGCGKTTVSEELADRLSMELIDTDKIIEETEGCSINEIFAESGENAFRDMETELLETINSDHWREFVISLGGGMPVRETNRNLFKKIGKVVYLRTSAETVYDRLKGDTSRPLLKSEDPLSRIKELMKARSEYYESAADIVVDTDDKSVADIVDEIVKKLGI